MNPRKTRRNLLVTAGLNTTPSYSQRPLFRLLVSTDTAVALSPGSDTPQAPAADRLGDVRGIYDSGDVRGGVQEIDTPQAPRRLGLTLGHTEIRVRQKILNRGLNQS